MLRQISESLSKIRSLRSLNMFQEADKIREQLVKLGVKIEILRNGSVLWWLGKERGYSGDPLKAQSQRDALSHLLARTYRFRKPESMNALYIEPDYTYKSKDELMGILIGAT